MSKKAWSPGRMIRSLNTCGCGLQRSPETALMLSTCSDPRSNRNFVTSATRSLSRTPGLRRSDEHLVRAVDHRAGRVEQHDLVDRLDLAGVEHDLLGVHDGDPLGLERRDHRRLDDVDAERHVEHALGLQDLADLAGRPPEQAGVGRHGAAQADHPGVDVVLGQPRAVQSMVLGRGPEVPDVRAAAARLERVARHLVAGPLADVRAGDVADVVEVEQQHRAKVGGVERGPGAAEAVRPEAVGVDPLLPVDGHRSRRRERPHPDPSLQARRDTGAIAPFTNATQRWSGRNPAATLDR